MTTPCNGPILPGEWDEVQKIHAIADEWNKICWKLGLALEGRISTMIMERLLKVVD